MKLKISIPKVIYDDFCLIVGVPFSKEDNCNFFDVTFERWDLEHIIRTIFACGAIQSRRLIKTHSALLVKRHCLNCKQTYTDTSVDYYYPTLGSDEFFVKEGYHLEGNVWHTDMEDCFECSNPDEDFFNDY